MIDVDDAKEIERVAASVAAGTDAIEVPAALIRDVPLAPPSLYAQIQTMTVPQRVKLAIRGNKDARMILIRDSNRLIQRMVLQNPRISDDEVLAIAKNRNCDEELLRIIGRNRDWTKAYPLRAALVENPKTPIILAVRLLGTLAERELRALAKSKNVPNVIASQARRILFQKEATR